MCPNYRDFAAVGTADILYKSANAGLEVSLGTAAAFVIGAEINNNEIGNACKAVISAVSVTVEGSLGIKIGLAEVRSALIYTDTAAANDRIVGIK